jgi:hypothetical protein
MEVISILNIEELEFTLIIKDVIKIAFEVEYKSQR